MQRERGADALAYVLPIRRWRPGDLDELGGYLAWLAGEQALEVIVVDGSAPAIFDAHHRAWSGFALHVPVDADLTGRYGKVNGVITGLRAATRNRVVVADDDVRWDAPGLARAASVLDHADLVCPQNYFDVLPWHARWDSARSLFNRAAGIDFPGTLVIRRSVVLDVGGYDGDCLFENLELIRTVQAAGGRAVSAPDLFVRRHPPSAHHFWSQRVRQAYDELAQPLRFVGSLVLAPLAAIVAARRPTGLAAGAVVAAAEVGRRRSGGTSVFPASCSWLAPAWMAERALCTWIALGCRLCRGGVPYAGTVLSKTATPSRHLRRRLRDQAGRTDLSPDGRQLFPEGLTAPAR